MSTFEENVNFFDKLSSFKVYTSFPDFHRRKEYVFSGKSAEYNIFVVLCEQEIYFWENGKKISFENFFELLPKNAKEDVIFNLNLFDNINPEL